MNKQRIRIPLGVKYEGGMLPSILLWSQRFGAVSVLSSHFPEGYHDRYSQHELLVGVGQSASIRSLEQLENTLKSRKDWLFGHLSYDLKNKLENLGTRSTDAIGFDDCRFFVPEIVLAAEDQLVAYVHQAEHPELENLRSLLSNKMDLARNRHAIEMAPQFTQEAYKEKIARIKNHLQNGDIYEINYCVEFLGAANDFRAEAFFLDLSQKTVAPFSAFYKMDNKYLLCASPERYLARRGDTLISQPIKGTKRRDPDTAKDAQLKLELQQSTKERSENVMIVDLVRNDLSRVAAKNSVQVEELFGVYSFPGVHQLISTVLCRLGEEKSSVDAIRASFPMGSMTGAPKIRAMQLIDELERSARGLYSGAVGYFAPSGDFDFNVVIRSLQYNSATNTLSLKVGGAITIASVAEEEYAECLLKADNILRLLEGDKSGTAS
jgi:para-aminobenzoate synthetase component I